MSIDFTGITGVSDDYGVVTQIADESGRVLWSAGPLIVYLRPSADISLTHPVYPTTLTAGYLAICEEVSDGEATYIGAAGVTHEQDFDYLSSFKMAASKPAKIKRVISAKIVMDANVSIGSSTSHGDRASCVCAVMVSGQEVFSGNKGIAYTANGKESFDSVSDADTTNLVTAINEFINSNGGGVLPEITVTIENLVGAANTKPTYTSYLTQFYIELTCE